MQSVNYKSAKSGDMETNKNIRGVIINVETNKNSNSSFHILRMSDFNIAVQYCGVPSGYIFAPLSSLVWNKIRYLPGRRS